MNAPTSPPTPPPRRRAEVAAWALYDTANSAFFLIVVTAFFPFFFRPCSLCPLPGFASPGSSHLRDWLPDR